MTVADSFGDGCDWYDSNPSGCGGYDTSTFIAADACIACGACDDGAEAAPVSAIPDCTVEEADNHMGPNQCDVDYECAGDRTCQAGWCTGQCEAT